MPLLLLVAAAAALIALMTNKNGGAAAPSGKAGFFTRLRPVASAVERETGIKADLGMVQAAHESAYGSSQLTREANNLFGFTGDSWKAAGKPVVEMPPWEVINGRRVELTRPFRRYGSWDESYRDWARLMQTPRYAAALAAARAGNLKAFAAALQAAGYATDPAYAAKLEGVARAAGVA